MRKEKITFECATSVYKAFGQKEHLNQQVEKNS